MTLINKPYWPEIGAHHCSWRGDYIYDDLIRGNFPRGQKTFIVKEPFYWHVGGIVWVFVHVMCSKGYIHKVAYYETDLTAPR